MSDIKGPGPFRNMAAALVALVFRVSSGQAAAHVLRPAGSAFTVVANFNPAQGQNPENLVVARDGTVYVTWLFAHSVVAVRPDGAQTVVPLPPGEASGIAIDPARPDRLTVGLVSPNPGHRRHLDDPGQRLLRPRATSTAGGPAGIGLPQRARVAPDGTLYVADSTRGLILKLPAGSAAAATWLSSSLLTPTGGSFDGVPLPGVNGLKVHAGQLYATNTARELCCGYLSEREPRAPR